jgi:hypothetical protein
MKVYWIEEAVATRSFRPPMIKIHTANPSAAQKMYQAVRFIQDLSFNGGQGDPGGTDAP